MHIIAYFENAIEDVKNQPPSGWTSSVHKHTVLSDKATHLISCTKKAGDYICYPRLYEDAEPVSGNTRRLMNAISRLTTNYYATMYCFTNNVYLMRIVKPYQQLSLYRDLSFVFKASAWSEIEFARSMRVVDILTLLRTRGLRLSVRSAAYPGAIPSVQVTSGILPAFDNIKSTYNILDSSYYVTLQKLRL